MSARRKNSARRRVLRAYSEADLARICTMPESAFGDAFGMQTTEVEQYAWQPWSKDAKAAEPVTRDYYHFRDNGSSVLAVAHLDTVVPYGGRVPRFSYTQNGPVITSGALDDRLGAYVILKLLPSLGLTCDWLLTVGEETGQSTAAYFTPSKDYDWVIEFDRGGTDVVMYQYEDAAGRAAVRACGAVMGKGSFSDICYLDALNVKAFNWGVGYRGDYHSVKGYAHLYDTFAMVAKYLRFHEQNDGRAMPHTPPLYVPPARRARAGSGGYDCEQCYALGEVDRLTLICAQCHSCHSCGLDELECRCFVKLKELTGDAYDDAGDIEIMAARETASEDDGSTTVTWEEYTAQRPASA